jgi:hypothetical protein
VFCSVGSARFLSPSVLYCTVLCLSPSLAPLLSTLTLSIFLPLSVSLSPSLSLPLPLSLSFSPFPSHTYTYSGQRAHATPARREERALSRRLGSSFCTTGHRVSTLSAPSHPSLILILHSRYFPLSISLSLSLSYLRTLSHLPSYSLSLPLLSSHPLSLPLPLSPGTPTTPYLWLGSHSTPRRRS